MGEIFRKEGNICEKRSVSITRDATTVVWDSAFFYIVA